MKKISLHSHIGLFNFSKYNIYEDGDLELEIDGNRLEDTKIEVVVDNGSSQKRYLCENNIVSIGKDFIKVGILKIKVNILIKEEVVRSYVCEDLIITDNKDNIEAIPEFAWLKSEYKALSDKMYRLENLVSQLYGINIKVGNKDE